MCAFGLCELEKGWNNVKRAGENGEYHLVKAVRLMEVLLRSYMKMNSLESRLQRVCVAIVLKTAWMLELFDI